MGFEFWDFVGSRSGNHSAWYCPFDLFWCNFLLVFCISCAVFGSVEVHPWVYYIVFVCWENGGKERKGKEKVIMLLESELVIMLFNLLYPWFRPCFQISGLEDVGFAASGFLLWKSFGFTILTSDRLQNLHFNNKLVVVSMRSEWYRSVFVLMHVVLFMYMCCCCL